MTNLLIFDARTMCWTADQVSLGRQPWRAADVRSNPRRFEIGISQAQFCASEPLLQPRPRQICVRCDVRWSTTRIQNSDCSFHMQ